jgi:hypothetical protein
MIYGSVFEGFRNLLSKMGTGGYSLHKLFTCFMCLGTWMGFAVSAIMIYFGYGELTPIGSLGVKNMYLIVFFNGLFIVLTIQFIFLMLTLLTSRSNPKQSTTI